MLGAGPADAVTLAAMSSSIARRQPFPLREIVLAADAGLTGSVRFIKEPETFQFGALEANEVLNAWGGETYKKKSIIQEKEKNTVGR